MRKIRNWIMDWLWIDTLLEDQRTVERIIEIQSDEIEKLYDIVQEQQEVIEALKEKQDG